MKKQTKYNKIEEEEQEEDDYGYDYSDNEEEEEEEEDIESGSQEEDSDDSYDSVEEEEEEGKKKKDPKSEQLEKLKRSLAHVSFEQLAEIKNKMKMNEEDDSDDSNGDESDDPSKNRKKPNKAQIIRELKLAASKLKGTRKRATPEDMKRSSKHRPMEISSKKKVSRFREVVETVSTKKRRDPRFDKLSGKLNQDLFEKSYGFIKDYKQSEKEQLQQRLAKTKNIEERDILKQELITIKSRETQLKNDQRKRELARERKKIESELVQQGKTPYFLKRSEKRKLELMDKFNQLGEKNMDRVLEKKRKRNANKDHRRLPFKRRSA